jgi:hypothetical protein
MHCMQEDHLSHSGKPGILSDSEIENVPGRFPENLSLDDTITDADRSGIKLNKQIKNSKHAELDMPHDSLNI